MAPHLSASELNFVFAEKGKGLSPTAVHSKLSHRRSKRGVPAPTLGNLRKTLKGTTYKRGKVESRGQKKTLTFQKLRAINATRKKMIKKAGGEEEVTWGDLVRAGRLRCDPTALAKNMKRVGFDVSARKQREKPLRAATDVANRYRICGKWKSLPASRWQKLHLIMDNKSFRFPSTVMIRKAERMKKVRFVLRTRKEGLKPGFTKPSGTKHTRMQVHSSKCLRASSRAG